MGRRENMGIRFGEGGCQEWLGWAAGGGKARGQCAASGNWRGEMRPFQLVPAPPVNPEGSCLRLESPFAGPVLQLSRKY